MPRPTPAEALAADLLTGVISEREYTREMRRLTRPAPRPSLPKAERRAALIERMERQHARRAR